MDLFSAARRLSRPFLFTEENAGEELPIAARGVIGDGFTCALVRADGAIDWLCLPRFDSPSVFGAVLDPKAGGITGVHPARRPFESLQRYDPDTNVLETLFFVRDEGVVRITDYMPWTGDPRLSVHEVHRRIQCVEGAVELLAVFDPRFDYGRDVPHLETQEHGVYARSATGDSVVAVLSRDAPWKARHEGGLEARFRLRAGERSWMVLSWNAPRAEPIASYRPYEHLRSTRHHWREWTRRIRYDGPWRHHVMRSALVLKLLQYAPTGAMVAAPTTSLPEWLGGTRNWDYRFSWTRDSAMGVRAANLLGCANEARDFFHFVRDTLDRDHELQIMYALSGGPVPEEEVLPHLAGYAASGPVRIGNGAKHQVQLDTAGALLDAAFMYERAGGSLTLRAWRSLRKVVDITSARWSERDHGIWEPRGEMQHNVHSKLMSWLAIDRGAQLAPLFGDVAHQRAWQAEAQKVRADLCTNGLDARGNHFVSAYGQETPDAALLLLPTHGFLPPTDPRIVRTVDWVRSALSTGPFLHRYPLHVDDGVGGAEGAFILCGFWLAEALAMMGRIDEAQEVFLSHAESSNHLGLLAEEIDPTSRALLGNFPQAFSHLGLINAAARLDIALRLHDEGSHAVPEPVFERHS